jgi:hypothetical protein
LRWARFSRSVSSRPRGFFVRPAGLLDRRLIPLEPCVLVQHDLGWVSRARLLGDPLVMGLAGIGSAEEQYASAGAADHEHVLVGVRLLLAAGVPGLFFGFFGRCRRRSVPSRMTSRGPGGRKAASPSGRRHAPGACPGRPRPGAERGGGEAAKNSPGRY